MHCKSPYDRILATRFGVAAVHLVAEEQYGRMVSLKNNKMTSIPIYDVAGKMRLITVDNSMIKTALSLGLCLGNPVEQTFEEFYANFSDEYSNADR